MPSEQPVETIAWLIERRTSPPQWSSECSPTGVGAFYSDIHRAHRFTTKSNAEEAMRGMSITPQERGEYFVSEHIWFASRAAAMSPAGEVDRRGYDRAIAEVVAMLDAYIRENPGAEGTFHAKWIKDAIEAGEHKP